MGNYNLARLAITVDLVAFFLPPAETQGHFRETEDSVRSIVIRALPLHSSDLESAHSTVRDPPSAIPGQAERRLVRGGFGRGAAFFSRIGVNLPPVQFIKKNCMRIVSLSVDGKDDVEEAG